MKIEERINPQSLKEKYLSKKDENGFVRLGDISRQDFDGRQVQYIARLLDGSEGNNLSEGLKFEGNSGNYPDMKIHIDNLSEFIDRVKKYYSQK